MSRQRQARPKSNGGHRNDDGVIRYAYVWRLHAVMLPDGKPLKCPSSGKNVCATVDKAEKVAAALEAIDGLRMVAYPCSGTNHYHVAREVKRSRKENHDQSRSNAQHPA